MERTIRNDRVVVLRGFPEENIADGIRAILGPSYKLLARGGGSHRDAGQMRRVILDFGELPRLGRCQ